MTFEVMTFHRSKARVFPIFCLGLAFVVLCAFLMKVAYDKQGAGGFGVFVGIVGILFFGVCTGFFFVALFDRRPALQFVREGLLASDISSRLIGWQDILDVRLVTYKNEQMIELILSPSAEKSLPFKRAKRVLRPLNRAFGFEGVFMNTYGLDLPANAIADLLVERIKSSRLSGQVYSQGE